jgi:RND superfamily putative drug exporter
VVISMLGMVLIGLSFVTGMAVAISTVAAATMLASLTLVPALLGFAGGNVEITRRRGLVAALLVAVGLVGVGAGVGAVGGLAFGLALVLVLPGLLAAVASLISRRARFVGPLVRGLDRLTPRVLRQAVTRRPRRSQRATLAYRWSPVIQHHPWAAAITASLPLLVVALPILGLRLGFSDEGTYPRDTTTRKAYDLLADGFGRGYNGSLMLVSELPTDGSVDEARLNAIHDELAAVPGVAGVSPPQVSQRHDAVFWAVTPTTSPQDEATTRLVHRLRDDVVPGLTRGTGLDIAVSGQVAVLVDFANYLASRLPYFLGAVLILSFLLLMTVFRSVLVPLKAVVMNLLSIGAAYGVIVAGFQWGWLGGPLGFDKAPIESWLPMMTFAIVFGLSMDYEVFLLSRVKEEWLRTGDSHTSVADGLAATARVISAAALIMVFVFGAFLFEPDRLVKLMGTGLTTAVLVDATVVRMVLVPASMELLGDRNWWFPRWLDRLLPRVDVERPRDDLDVPEPGVRELEPV